MGNENSINRRNMVKGSLGALAGFSFLSLHSQTAAADLNHCNSWTSVPEKNMKVKYLWRQDQQDPNSARCLLLEADKDLKIEPHSHPGGELIYVVFGQFKLTSIYPDETKEVTEIYQAGDTILVPDGTIHTEEVPLEPTQVLIFVPSDTPPYQK